ncbi:MAG: hypothetical protein AB199_02720 [Parcubacteria bacterium C7867-004]|nr:MAG: hypothetical protein AB199_02720 [Parcubacteria bacterium C7867-004]
MKNLTLAAISIPVLLVLDLLWIGVIAAGFYKAELGPLLRPDIVWQAAVLFYVIYAFGLAFFVVRPALESGQAFKRTALAGAFFGLVAFATCDLTNLATIAGWSTLETFVDMGWGVIATTIATTVSYFAGKKLLGY